MIKRSEVWQVLCNVCGRAASDSFNVLGISGQIEADLTKKAIEKDHFVKVEIPFNTIGSQMSSGVTSLVVRHVCPECALIIRGTA
jgi:hypothetical protein